MKNLAFFGMLFVLVPLVGQEEADTVLTPEPLIEDSLMVTQDSVATEIELEDTVASAVTLESDTVSTAPELDILLSLDAGYKRFAWGIEKGLLTNNIEVEALKSGDREDVVVASGFLGEDSVLFNYYFSDKGFWKVAIDYLYQMKEMEEYIDHFSRIEKFLTKRYGPPKRTTQNEIGTNMEYLFSDFPKLSRAYFRSSWMVENVKIELILDAVVSKSEEVIPVFDDLKPLLRLYYYHPDFYENVEFPTTEIPEETLIDAY